jgi:hypothetical protein
MHPYLYHDSDRTIVWSVTVGPEANPTIGDPEEAFVLDTSFLIGQGRFDIGADGRLLGLREPEPWFEPPEIEIVLNWFEELRRLAPRSGR